MLHLTPVDNCDVLTHNLQATVQSLQMKYLPEKPNLAFRHLRPIAVDQCVK